MRKMIFTLFLMLLIGVGFFTQKRNSDYFITIENFNVHVERQCYDITSSFTIFRLCVRKPSPPVCTAEWELKVLDVLTGIPFTKVIEKFPPGKCARSIGL